jgi:glycosyltransferase involved in cell wall biosynthesis
MGDSPKVSIVIPVYNGSSYLREAIDSALAQTYDNVEVIVVNDGSNDGGKTEAIAKSYGDRIRYFAKPNGGVASALNLGIRQMTGEWFSWLSHDDYYYPGKVENQIEFAKANPGAKVVLCNTAIMDAAGHTVYEYNREVAPILRGATAHWQTWIFACSLLIHKSCFDVIGMVNESNHTTQDIELVLLLLHHFDVYHLPQVLVKRRKHSESGIHVRKQLNDQEYETLIQRLLDEYGMSFFLPGLDYHKSDPTSLAVAYNKLGDHYLIFGDKRFGSYCYRTSVRLWLSPLNVSLYKSLFGSSVLLWWHRNRVRRRIVWRITKVGRIPGRIVRGMRMIRGTLSEQPVTQWPSLLRDLWTERQRRLGRAC